MNHSPKILCSGISGASYCALTPSQHIQHDSFITRVTWLNHRKRRVQAAQELAAFPRHRLSCVLTRSVLQCVAVCCSVLQCVAVCCSVLLFHVIACHVCWHSYMRCWDSYVRHDSFICETWLIMRSWHSYVRHDSHMRCWHSYVRHDSYMRDMTHIWDVGTHMWDMTHYEMLTFICETWLIHEMLTLICETWLRCGNSCIYEMLTFICETWLICKCHICLHSYVRHDWDVDIHIWDMTEILKFIHIWDVDLQMWDMTHLQLSYLFTFISVTWLIRTYDVTPFYAPFCFICTTKSEPKYILDVYDHKCAGVSIPSTGA